CVPEENVKGATHTDGATCQSNLQEVFTVCVAGRLYGREHCRNPDDEDADVKTPTELAAGNSRSRESHAMRSDAESEAAGGQRHERVENNLHSARARGNGSRPRS